MRKQLGKQGEDIAARYLLEQGYKILVRNYRTRYGELDLICTKNDIIVFVEVKTRNSNSFGSPEESITRSKIEHIRKVALSYLAEQRVSFREMRFDVIGIVMEQNQPRINHIIAAF